MREGERLLLNYFSLDNVCLLPGRDLFLLLAALLSGN